MLIAAAAKQTNIKIHTIGFNVPDRIVRVGILTSDPVNTLSWGAEVFYRRLMSVVDDFGRFDGRGSVLRASLYALKVDRVSEPDIGKWICECEEAGLVRMYTVNGKPFIEIAKFGQRVRAQVSKWPDPPDSEGNMLTNDSSRQHGLSNAPVVVSEVVFEDVGGSESAARAASAVDLSIEMRKAGIQTQPADPRLIALAEQGVSCETVASACAEAKRSKPDETIGLGYVVKILERWAKDAAAVKASGASAPLARGQPAPFIAKPIQSVEKQVPSLANMPKKTEAGMAAAAEARKALNKAV